MKIEGIFVAGLGACVPEPFSAAEAVRLGMYDAGEYERGGWTGAAVAGDVPAPDLAVRAARQALARSAHDVSEVGLLLHANLFHQGLDGWSPHHYVQRHTIGGRVPAFSVGQTCNGMLGAMELASCHLTAAQGPAAALITGADNFGAPLVDRWRYAEGATTNRGTILGDAGTAVVLSRRAGFARLRSIASASLPELEELYRGDVPLFPPGSAAGVPMAIGARVAEFAARNPKELEEAKETLRLARVKVAERALADAGVTPGQVTRATHIFSGGEAYVRAILEPLGIDPSRGVLEYGRGLGHLSVNDQVAGLNHLVETGAVGPGDHVLMLANGAGVALSCAVVEILDPVDWTPPAG
ncbi:hypothetical protein Ssi03_06890 [Sphaerisporangium siamense]|uniref:3-oxoacyl-[acyl-carrier-protein] synthase-3 n=1 Tax=Sphaerisporangium siamense TaxID=795645 RepID=A0A7W7DHL2_9ACTN|nr:ketoacyl-ACP synthase III family protein [Sphaerisporangium siamense]MBB4705906.1 3-oxoacyl-[acyl-carrier-protein] synthase-3 [Sphaerisporangium siamense]GII82699.1 hypothetical protein Ssi03_06890 [Sphaerisporangium siamense]